MDFGPWLARQLKQSHMSQAELAQRVGLTRAAVSAWITGRATPREETIAKIAEALDTDLGTIHTRTADTLAGLPVSWSHRPGYADGGRDFGNAAAFAFEADVEVLAREATQNSLDERLDLNQPVRVRYTLHELTGEALARFRDEIRWDDLLPHYEAAAAQDQKVGRVIAAGLRDMYERDRLVLLRVDDYNASGLTGDDYETGRFAAVVRRQLDSHKSASGAGGSYGLGKATLWATSRLGLVLMNSTLSEPHEGRTERRLIGRLDLPWREVDGQPWAAPPGSVGPTRTRRTPTSPARGGPTRRVSSASISRARAPSRARRSWLWALTTWRASSRGPSATTTSRTTTAFIACTTGSWRPSDATSGRP